MTRWRRFWRSPLALIGAAGLLALAHHPLDLGLRRAIGAVHAAKLDFVKERRGERVDAEEAPAELADLAGGQDDPVRCAQCRTDLLALSVVDEPLETDAGHHVVADGAPGQQPLGDRGLALDDRAAGPAGGAGREAAGGADVHGLADPEAAVPALLTSTFPLP